MYKCSVGLGEPRPLKVHLERVGANFSVTQWKGSTKVIHPVSSTARPRYPHSPSRSFYLLLLLFIFKLVYMYFLTNSSYRKRIKLPSWGQHRHYFPWHYIIYGFSYLFLLLVIAHYPLPIIYYSKTTTIQFVIYRTSWYSYFHYSPIDYNFSKIFAHYSINLLFVHFSKIIFLILNPP